MLILPEDAPPFADPGETLVRRFLIPEDDTKEKDDEHESPGNPNAPER